MAPSSKKEDVSSSLSKLNLDPPKNTAAKKPKKKPVADSWEDESSESETDEQPSQPEDLPTSPPPQSSSGAKAPPPTPITPNCNTGPPSDWASHSPNPGPASPDPERRRPEKTDAVARRMIASALGVKAPRMTEEQRAYDRSVREQERKRREQEKAAERQKQEDAERAKAAMWED